MLYMHVATRGNTSSKATARYRDRGYNLLVQVPKKKKVLSKPATNL